MLPLIPHTGSVALEPRIYFSTLQMRQKRYGAVKASYFPSFLEPPKTA